MTATIDSRWDEMLDALVREGRYASREEAVGEAMRLLDDHETAFRELKASIAEALADPRRYTSEEVLEHVRQHLEERRKTLSAAE
jgi:putative addiction module CopG family antidote